jgi:hypothetical protein
MQSAFALRRETFTVPFSSATSQRAVRLPASVRSKRSVPFAFSSSGRAPPDASAWKKSVVASAIELKPPAEVSGKQQSGAETDEPDYGKGAPGPCVGMPLRDQVGCWTLLTIALPEG